MKPLHAQIDWESGVLSQGVKRVRRVSDMIGLYHDEAAEHQAVAEGDPIVYEYTTIELPEEANHVLFGTTTIFPGRVGSEYYMTKGHYHERRDTGEVYVCFSGQGRLVMETEAGQTEVLAMFPGSVAYVPPHWAHRVSNVGDDPLLFFAAFPGHAGHDYGTIAQVGFRLRVEEHGGEVLIVDNT